MDLEEVSMALRRSFQRCDHEILATSKAEDNWKGGTTACVALSIDQVYRCYELCISVCTVLGMLIASG